jgi:hypothetical protein
VLYFLLLAAVLAGVSACDNTTSEVDGDDLEGVVTGPNGPEAGVWVIAETHDLPTRFAKIVVTDEEGRYLIPDLPDATYSVWVRGYGLVDSPKQETSPGTTLDLEAVVAPDPQAAAYYYPAGYWFSLLDVPPKSEFPGTGADGNGISPNVKTQADFLRNIKSADLSPAFGDGPVGGSARRTEQVSRLGVDLAAVIRDERGSRPLQIAGPYRLVDIGMVRDRPLELRGLAESAFAHHPGDEGRRPPASS